MKDNVIKERGGPAIAKLFQRLGAVIGRCFHRLNRNPCAWGMVTVIFLKKRIRVGARYFSLNFDASYLWM